ncbi:MAG: RIP metalloprotease RseP [Bacteroidota bacterium]
MEILSTVFYFIVTIGILVFIHELGHFLAAKMFGMRVDRFSIGFPPRAFGKQIGETDYCVSWVPIGGYVKIAGMVDESMDTEFLNQDPQPWEFRSKPIWQRMVVISAGVIMNILLAIAIFWGIIYHEGRIVRPVTEVGYVIPNSPAAKAGLRMDDKILSINKQSVTQWDEIENLVYAENMGNDLEFSVSRNNATVQIPIRRADIPDFSEERFGILPAGLIAVVATVDEGKPAKQIGLQPGDTILAVNKEAVSYGSLPETVRKYPGKEILLSWKRGSQRFDVPVTPTSEGRIGITLGAVYNGPVTHVQYGFFGALPAGVHEVVVASRLFLTNIFQIVVGKTSLAKSVGGPIKIAQMANRSAESGAASFLGFMALLSMSLALLNIFPFPALDGGHLVFLVYEGVFRREIPHKVKIAIQQAGVFLLLVFMAFVLYNDIVNF